MTRTMSIARLLVAGVFVMLAGGNQVFGRQAAAGAQAAPDAGSIAALTDEVRMLRLAIEKSARRQVEIQALNVYLSAEQSRLQQLSAQAEGIRHDLDAAIGETGEATDDVTRIEEKLSGLREPDRPTRIEFEQVLVQARQRLVRAARAETELRTRLVAANADVDTELTRWRELLSRLDQATR